MKNSIVIFFILFIININCKKHVDENNIPDNIPTLEAIQQNYTEILTAEPQGWYMEYRPTTAATTISVLVKFSDNGTSTITSDYHGYTDDQQNVHFRVGGILKPELIFETYAVFHAIAENIGGRFEFYITPIDENQFSLTQVNGSINTHYILRRATATDKANIQAKAATALLLEEFSANASAYFKNLQLENFSAFWEISTDQQSLKLSWQNDMGAVESKSFSYNYIPNGILLDTPFIKGTLSIDSILFGTMDGNNLQITHAGNAGSGDISVSHIPAFPYKGTANLFMRIEHELPRFFAYTLDDLDTYYSKDLQPYIIALREYMSPDFFRIQLYHYNMNATGTTPENQLNSMQLLIHNNEGANVFLPYYTSLQKKDESHVIVTPLGTTNSSGAPYLEKVLEFMNIIFPTEGVTIIPAGRAGTLQRLRIISRKNSRIYFDITVSTPSNIYLD